MKSPVTASADTVTIPVTLYTRVWIEIRFMTNLQKCVLVTLYTRVWIEIKPPRKAILRGLVTLYTRVWIEITQKSRYIRTVVRHPLHEGVD